MLLAPAAILRPGFEHALTLDDAVLDEQLHGLIQDVEGGYVRNLAFLAPTPMPWPMPLYELALMTARRAYDMNVDVSITLVTPEDAPLAIFGAPVSEAVARLLEENNILTLTSAHAVTPEVGQVSVRPGSRQLRVDRIVALPKLFGPDRPGVPTGSAGGVHPGRHPLPRPDLGARLGSRGRHRLRGQDGRDRRAAGGHRSRGDRGPRRRSDRA